MAREHKYPSLCMYLLYIHMNIFMYLAEAEEELVEEVSVVPKSTHT